MKFLLFIVLAAIVVAVVLLYLHSSKKRGKPVGKDYIVITDKVVAAGGPKLPEGVDYRFYDKLKVDNARYTRSYENQLVIFFNGTMYNYTVYSNRNTPAAALKEAAEDISGDFYRAYATYEREKQLKDFIYKSNDLPVIGKRVDWQED